MRPSPTWSITTPSAWGTTLQVGADMWPPDRAAFDEYWKNSLEELRIDPRVREHLHGVASLAFLPWPLRISAGAFNLFATTGFLAPEFRAMMLLDRPKSRQRRFQSLLSVLRLADRLIPQQIWIFGYRINCGTCFFEPDAVDGSFRGSRILDCDP